MRSVSHRSPIAAIKAALTEWRNTHGWSRETVVDEVVAAHKRIGAERRTGVQFSDHHDPATRQKTNADRVYRWLDDDDNDRNLLSVNMLPSVLAGMPADVALATLNEILAPAGFVARPVGAASTDDVNAHELVQEIMRVNHRTEAAAGDLLDGIDPGELPRLHNSLLDEITVKKTIASRVEATMRRTGESVATLIRKVSN